MTNQPLQGQVSTDGSNYTLKVFGAERRNKVFPPAAPALLVQFVQPIKTDGIKHVALCPQLFMAIARKGIDAKKVMPVPFDFGSCGGNGNHCAELAAVRGCWGYDDNLTHLQHFRRDKAAREIAQQHIALFRIVVERQSIDPIKARPPEGGLNRRAVELASPYLRRWLNPEREPDSCRLAPVTKVLCGQTAGNSTESRTYKNARERWGTLQAIANRKHPAYSSPVATLLATGFGDPITVRRISATVPKAGAFFMPATSFYGGCARDTFGYAGCLTSRFANPRTAATQYRLATISGGSSTLGAVPMNHIHTALKNRAAAHKAMAFAALRADSSASVRLGRYRKHITRSRTLLALADVVGGAV